MKIVLQGIVLAAVALAGAPLYAQSGEANQSTSKPTVVLVHGAFGDAESWDKVIDLLQHQGVKVISASIPMTSLADDVAATNRAIDRAAGQWYWSGIAGGEP